MKDQISALMDDELALESSEHLLVAAKADSEVSKCWATYHLIGDVMRGNLVFKPDFQQRLMQKLDMEPVALVPRTRKSWIKTSAAWSVAASVAAVMFVGWVVMQQQGKSSTENTPVEIAQNLPSEYLLAHQAMAPSSTAYYIQPAAYSENGQ